MELIVYDRINELSNNMPHMVDVEVAVVNVVGRQIMLLLLLMTQWGLISKMM